MCDLVPKSLRFARLSEVDVNGGVGQEGAAIGEAYEEAPTQPEQQPLRRLSLP
jgi:hypothetical protein